MIARWRSALANAPKDLFAGLIFVLFGLGTFWKAHDYEIGSAVEMGPGYFPAIIGLVLAALGLAAIARGLSRKTPDPITPHKLEPLLLVFAGIVAFSLLIERLGLYAAAAALIGIVCCRRLLRQPLEVLAIYVALTGFAALVLVHWFGLQMRLY